ncbi:MAG: LacI family DNA-binding transcriptional regulator [Spirochaetes bacterium]|nr:LacI family DNA-binding transcriptional regulator [Spirochaetota bacterium]
MATIKDVAALSETSVGTVSRYLNGYEIKESNRIRIEQAITSLNFKINAIAQGLKNKKTMTVGILIPRLSNIFSTSIIEGMEKIFDKNGYSILVCDSRNNVKIEEKKINFLHEKQVDGIIIMPCDDSGEHIKQEQNNGMPIVLMDRLVNDIDCDAVICDNVTGSYEAVQKLIENGHKNIGIITGQKNIFTSDERIKGYVAAHKENRLKVDKSLIIHADYTDKETGRKALINIVRSHRECTAVFATNYELTIGVIEGILDMKLVIGKDIAVFGYDQEDLIHVIRPSISIVKQPMNLIGEKAAKLLIKRMSGDRSDFPTIHKLRTELILTDSLRLRK